MELSAVALWVYQHFPPDQLFTKPCRLPIGDPLAASRLRTLWTALMDRVAANRISVGLSLGVGLRVDLGIP